MWKRVRDFFVSLWCVCVIAVALCLLICAACVAFVRDELVRR